MVRLPCGLLVPKDVPRFIANGTYASTATAAPITVNLPAGVAQDDLMLIVAFEGATTAAITATGWVQACSADISTTGRGTVLWRRFQTGDAAPSVNGPAGTGFGAYIVAYRGCRNGPATTNPPWDVTPTAQGNASSTTVTAPGLTTTSGNNLVVMTAHDKVDNTSTTHLSAWTVTTPGTLTERNDQDSNVSNGAGTGHADATKGAPGATGNGTATLASAAVNIGCLLALVPEQVFVPVIRSAAYERSTRW